MHLYITYIFYHVYHLCTLWHYSSDCRYLRWSAPVMPTWNLVPPTCPWHPPKQTSWKIYSFHSYLNRVVDGGNSKLWQRFSAPARTCAGSGHRKRRGAPAAASVRLWASTAGRQTTFLSVCCGLINSTFDLKILCRFACIVSNSLSEFLAFFRSWMTSWLRERSRPIWVTWCLASCVAADSIGCAAPVRWRWPTMGQLLVGCSIMDVEQRSLCSGVLLARLIIVLEVPYCSRGDVVSCNKTMSNNRNCISNIVFAGHARIICDRDQWRNTNFGFPAENTAYGPMIPSLTRSFSKFCVNEKALWGDTNTARWL